MENIDENPFEQLQRFFNEFNGEINIIDEEIDINLQMEYFEASKKLRSQELNAEWEPLCDKLSNELIQKDEHRQLLVQLAAIDNVKAYRCIEKYVANASPEIHHWALLALQESRMLIQSKLLEQSQVLISTGLGGKGNKLRYFFALFNKNNEHFVEYQQKILRNEFQFVFDKNQSEIEEIHFYENMASLVVLVPLTIPIQNLFASALTEVNQYGNFLRENCIITNVRKMSFDEIVTFLKNNSDK